MKRRLLLIITLLLCASFSSLAQNGSAPPTDIGLELVAEGMTSPIDLEQPADDSGRLLIADQVGVIWVIGSDGQLLDQPYLDIRDRMVEINASYDERGLLGFALHPDFVNNGRFFVYYSAPLHDEAPEDWDHTSILSEFTVSSENENQADLSSERVLMMVDQPQLNHNGGDISFGSDGYLYVPLGDGGAANDVATGHTQDLGNGQDLTKLLGKILRIDVNNGNPYGIPDDNPFLNNENARDEIWAYGFRNPWRLSFDDTYGLFAADLGQNVWEEVHIVDAGGNYGWNILEGTHCFNPDEPNHNPLECEQTDTNGDPLLKPIIEYNHQVGISIIGGYVYRGEAMPEGLQGTYVFGDWSTSFASPESHIFVATPPAEDVRNSMWKMRTLTIANVEADSLEHYILSFGVDNSGELYVLTTDNAGPSGDTGRVWRIVPADSLDEDRNT